MKKLVDGILVDMTAEEIAVREAEETAWNNGALDRALENLRFERNNLLSETDWWGASDNTMTAEQTQYRQDLRDITNGLTTVEEVNAVEFPEKP
jgi:hypothetical protein|tara:strand:+ start:119 stop:400 length:282 start_codon:yes stop_codon:yes gene_type:complete